MRRLMAKYNRSTGRKWQHFTVSCLAFGYRTPSEHGVHGVDNHRRASILPHRIAISVVFRVREAMRALPLHGPVRVKCKPPVDRTKLWKKTYFTS